MLPRSLYRSLTSLATATTTRTKLPIPIIPSIITIPTNPSNYLPLLSSVPDLPTLLLIHSRLLILGFIPHSSPIFFNYLIKAYTQWALPDYALKLYRHMLGSTKTEPDKYTYTYVIKACAASLDLEMGVWVHEAVRNNGLDLDLFIATALVDMYCKLGRVGIAREVFDRMSVRDVVSWNALIGGLAVWERPYEAVELFGKMQGGEGGVGFVPSSVSLLNLFPALCRLEDGRLCRGVHGFVIKREFFERKVFNGLIDVYSKCGRVEDARRVFDGMCKDHVSWGTMMAGYAHNGYFDEVLKLFDEMKSNNMVMNKVSAVSSALAASEMGDLDKGNEIHNSAIQHCIDSDIVVATSLMTMYLKCGDVEKAKQIFIGLKEKDLVAWSALIAAFVQGGFPQEALCLFREMVYRKIRPSSVTLLSVFPACTELCSWKMGKSIHCYSLKAGIDYDIAIGNTLVSMYAKCGLFTQALAIFHNMPNKNVVSWNALINGYADSGDALHALEVFREFMSSGRKPDLGTMTSVVSASTLLRDPCLGACVHGLIIKSGFEYECHLTNALIDMHAKCGLLRYAESLFNQTGFTRDHVSWNAMIAGYVRDRRPKEAILTFCRMRSEGFHPSAVSFVSVLPALVDLTALREGMAFHACIVRMGFGSNTPVGNSLIDMYAKCGRFDLGEKHFDEMENKDIVSWNTLLSGSALHGQIARAFAIFSEMQESDVVIDGVSFLSLLSACRHSGLVEEGRKIFASMRDDFHVEPKLEHYACMVDLLGRRGHFNEIMDLISDMPMEPDGAVWGALLGACRMHSNVELAEEALRNLVKLEPENSAHYVGLAGIYAQSGRWVEAKNSRLKLIDAGMRKNPGSSWV